MSLKKSLLKLYLWPMLPPERVFYYQEKIRNAEWSAVKPYIKPGSKFLDVGCGKGYNLWKAKNELGCDVQGIDPYRKKIGAGRDFFAVDESLPIDHGFAEFLPYENATYDVVFSSHVLEHVHSIRRSLREMKRVLKENGTIIVGMPTSAMSWIGLVSEVMFTTHIRWFNFLMKPFFNTARSKFKYLFLPPSHGKRNKTILYDLRHYRVSEWEKHVAQELKVKEILLPAMYPYPDYKQLFKMRKSKKRSSSVFFICTKP